MITILRTWSRGDYRRLSFIQVRVSGRSSCSHSFSPLDVGNIGAHHDNAKTKGLAPLKASRTLATEWLLDGETDNKELPKPIRRVAHPVLYVNPWTSVIDPSKYYSHHSVKWQRYINKVQAKCRSLQHNARISLVWEGERKCHWLHDGWGQLLYIHSPHLTLN